MVFDSVRGASIIRASEEKFDTVREQVVKELPEEKPSVEESRIADIALAVGLAEDRTKEEIEQPDKEFAIDTLSRSDAMKVIIEERHPDKEGADLRKQMQEYLNGGIEEIVEDIDEHSVFRYHRYLAEANSD